MEQKPQVYTRTSIVKGASVKQSIFIKTDNNKLSIHIKMVIGSKIVFSKTSELIEEKEVKAFIQFSLEDAQAIIERKILDDKLPQRLDIIADELGFNKVNNNNK